MSFFQAMLAGLVTEVGSIYDFALAHPGGFYFMGVLITLLTTAVHLFEWGWSKHTNWRFYAILILFWPIVLPGSLLAEAITRFWLALSELLDEPDGVSIFVQTSGTTTRRITVDQMTRENEAAQLKEFQKLTGELQEIGLRLHAQAKLFKALSLLEETRQFVQKEKEKVKSAGDAPVSKDVEVT